MMKSCLRLGVAASLAALVHTTALSHVAFAQQPGPDAVYLNDNNVLRGTLSEVVVGDHVTILLTNGQSARVVWSYVSRIDRAGVPQNYAAPGASPPPIVQNQPAPAEPWRGTATVHIEGADVALEQLNERGSWRRVCVTPCDQKLSLDGTYQIVGDGLRNSRGFQLHGNDNDRMTLSVSPASSSAFVGGIVLLSVGVVVGIAGIYVEGIASAEHDINGGGGSNAGQTVGWVMLVGGIAASVIGIVLWAGNGHTGVDQRLQESKPNAHAQSDIWKRFPLWHDHTTDAANAAMPKPISMPLFQAAF